MNFEEVTAQISFQWGAVDPIWIFQKHSFNTSSSLNAQANRASRLTPETLVQDFE
jgi:hypothetical protein